MKCLNTAWMNCGVLNVGLVSLLILSSGSNANAACVDLDASVMTAVYPRTEPAPIQENNVESNQSDRCFGNASATTNNKLSGVAE